MHANQCLDLLLTNSCVYACSHPPSQKTNLTAQLVLVGTGYNVLIHRPRADPPVDRREEFKADLTYMLATWFKVR